LATIANFINVYTPIEELRQQIRHEFEQQKNAEDIPAIKYYISEGRTRLRQMEEMLGMAV
jgi:Complex 1 protein (LYR family)